jgi:hypothetical protein
MMFLPYETLASFRRDCGYEIDGIWYPRVTKIVAIKAKPALYRYYAQSPDMETAEHVSRRAAEEGSSIHAAAQEIFLGRTVSAGHPFAPALETLTKFLQRKKIETEPGRIERRILHKEHGYAGTVDAVAKIGKKLGVLDIKTSSSIYRDYNLQTAAYLEALRTDFPEIETRWILRIDQYETCGRCGARRRTKGGATRVSKRGKHFCSTALGHSWDPPQGEVELRESRNWEKDFEAFLGAKRLWEWENERFLKKVNSLSAQYDIIPT